MPLDGHCGSTRIYLREGRSLVRHRKIEEAIIKLVSQSPRSPKEIVDSLSEQGFAVLEIRNTIWELLDSRKVEVTPDRRLEAAAPQRVARAS